MKIKVNKESLVFAALAFCVILLGISLSVVALTGGGFGATTTQEDESPPNSLGSTGGSPLLGATSAQNIQMNLGNGKLSANQISGTTITGFGGITMRPGGSGGAQPTLEIPKGGAIKFGDTWITEKHLQMLTGQADIKIQNDHYPGRTLDSGGYSGDNDSRPKSLQKGGLVYMNESGANSDFRRWTLRPW